MMIKEGGGQQNGLDKHRALDNREKEAFYVLNRNDDDSSLVQSYIWLAHFGSLEHHK